MDSIYEDLKQYTAGYELKYNKFYVGLSKGGVAKNFIFFKPKKSFLYFFFKADENPELVQKLEESGLDVVYESRRKRYRIKLLNHDEYKKHEPMIFECVEKAMEYFSIDEL